MRVILEGNTEQNYVYQHTDCTVLYYNCMVDSYFNKLTGYAHQCY